jgi:hypothetical protein
MGCGTYGVWALRGEAARRQAAEMQEKDREHAAADREHAAALKRLQQALKEKDREHAAALKRLQQALKQTVYRKDREHAAALKRLQQPELLHRTGQRKKVLNTEVTYKQYFQQEGRATDLEALHRELSGRCSERGVTIPWSQTGYWGLAQTKAIMAIEAGLTTASLPKVPLEELITPAQKESPKPQVDWSQEKGKHFYLSLCALCGRTPKAGLSFERSFKRKRKKTALACGSQSIC